MYDFERLENTVYNRSKWTRTTYRCTYGDSSLTRSKDRFPFSIVPDKTPTILWIVCILHAVELFGSLLLAQYWIVAHCRMISCFSTQYKRPSLYINHELTSRLQCPTDPQNAVVCFSLFYNFFAIFLTSLVHFMLEEVVNSTVNRCLSPELMEPSVSTQYTLVFVWIQ